MSLFTDEFADNLFDYFTILVVPTTSISILTGYDPTYIIVGAIGQFLSIASLSIYNVRKGKKPKHKPVWYWIVSIFVLGGVMGLLFTDMVSDVTGMSKLTSGILSGSVAQYAFDFILVFKDAAIKMILKKDSDEETD